MPSPIQMRRVIVMGGATAAPEAGGNVAPVITVPGAQNAPWNVTGVTPKNALTFTGGSAISVADSDNEPLTVTITVLHGVLTLAAVDDLVFSLGDGTADASMEFVAATPAALNAALDGMVYQADDDSVTADTLTITASDGTDDDEGAVAISVVSAGEVLDLTFSIGTVFQTVDGSAAGTVDPVGEAEDQSGEGHHATQGDAGKRPTLSATVPSVFSGDSNARSISLDGDDFATTPALWATQPTAYTVVAWVNPSSLGSGNQYISAWRDGLNIWWQLDVNGTDYRFLVADGSDVAAAQCTGVAATDTWACLIGVRNGDVVSLYADGVQGTDDTKSLGDITCSMEHSIGSQIGGGANWNGLLTKIKVYPFAISATQIAHLVAGGS